MALPSFNIRGAIRGAENKIKRNIGGLLGPALGPVGAIAGTAYDQLRRPPQPATAAGTPGIIPTTPVKKITSTNVDGSATTHEFHAPEPTAPTAAPKPAQPAQPAPTTPQVGTPTQNAQNVLDQSNLNANPEYQALAKQQNLLVQGQMGAPLAGVGGVNTLGNQLGGNYANLFAPQSTGNLAGEKGILNPLLSNAVAGNAAEAQRLISGGQLGTQGATSVFNASLPITGVPYGTQTIDPLTGKPVANTGGQFGTGPAASANVQSIKDLTSQKNNYNSSLQQAQNLGSQVTDLIKTFGLNPSDINAANAGIQRIAQNTSDPHYQALTSYINDIASRYSQVLTPPGGSATDTTRSIAQNMLDATAKGTSLITQLQTLDQQGRAVTAGIQTQLDKLNNVGTSGSTGGITFGWNGQ